MIRLRIDQFIPYLGYGDAISSHALWIRDTLRRLGHESTIYAEMLDSRMRGQGEPLEKYRPRGSGRIILHYCGATALSDFVLALGKKIVMIYHNITPYDYFQPVNYRTVQVTRKGREELGRFVEITELAIGASEFNRQELESERFSRTAVMPIVLNPKNLDIKPNSWLLRAYGNDGFTNFLFVGRIAPNKKQEDVLKVFAYYSMAIDPNSRLFVVGSSSGTDVYLEWLRDLVDRLCLDNVYFTGQVTQSELVAYYRLAHVFVCMSEHEGFCVPLLESMHFQVPVVAYACPAVAWTLGDAGILVKAKEYDIIAEAIHVVVTNERLRQKLIERQNARLRYFAPERVEGILREYLGI